METAKLWGEEQVAGKRHQTAVDGLGHFGGGVVTVCCRHKNQRYYNNNSQSDLPKLETTLRKSANVLLT